MSDLDSLLENEREWRRYMIEHVEAIKKDLSTIKAWNLVFRLSGGAVMALFYLWVEFKYLQ